MDFLGDNNNPSAVDVIAFVREVVEKFPDLRPAITEKLISTFSEIKSGKVFRGAMWIVGEYCTGAADIKRAIFELRKVIGEIPILASEQRLLDEAEAADETPEKPADQPKAITTTRVLADGTYATETVYTSNAAAARLEQVRSAAKPPLRALILGGDFFTGSVLAATLTKLVMRFSEAQSDAQAVNALRAESILIMTSVIRVGQSKFSAVPIDEDSQERIMNCIETLAQLQGMGVMNKVFLEDTKAAYAKMVKNEEKKAQAKKEKESKKTIVQVDDLISFSHLSKKTAGGDADDVSAELASKCLLTRSWIMMWSGQLEQKCRRTLYRSSPE